MTVSTNSPRAEYLGNGSTVGFNTPQFTATSDLKVYVGGTLQVFGTDYWITSIVPGYFGICQFNTAPISGAIISIISDTPILQNTNWVANDADPSEVKEAAFDKLTLISQRLNERIDRSMVLADYVTGVDTELPTPEASTFLGWDEDGTALVNYSPSDLITVAGSGNYTTDSFADGVDYTAGTTTELTLSINPGTKNATLVTFDGVVQNRDTYSISGTTLTFDTAIPVSTDTVEVWISSTLPVDVLGTEVVTETTLGYEPAWPFKLTGVSYLSSSTFGSDSLLDDEGNNRITIGTTVRVHLRTSDIWFTADIINKSGSTVYLDNMVQTDGSAATLLNEVFDVWLGGLSNQNGSNTVGFLQAGTDATLRTVQSKLRERVSVFDFMTQAQINDVVANTASISVSAAIQDAIDAIAAVGGGIVHFPAGTYGLTDCVIVRTSQGITLEGESMVTTIIQSLLVSHPTHNALIAIDIQPMNGAIKNLRLRTGNAGFSGWGIVAGTSTTGKNLFSTEIANIWCDFATNSQGFFLGGLYDCWIHHCQFENLRYRFKLEGSSSCGNRNIFSDINDIGGRTPFIEIPALQNTGMLLNNITISGAVGNSVLATRHWWLDIQNSDGWIISGIRYESGSSFDPATSYTGFIKMRNCRNMVIDGFFVEVDEAIGTSNCSGLYLSDTQAIISNGRLLGYSATRTFNPIEIAGTTNRLIFNGIEVFGGANQLNLNATAMGGTVEFTGCRFTKSVSRIISDAFQNHTMDIRFKNCTLINPHWGASYDLANYFFLLGTSGATEFIGCTIGRDLEGETGNASYPGTIFRLVGTGTGKIESCTLQRFNIQAWNYSTVTQRLPSSIVIGDAALADDGIIYLPNRTSGVATVQCGNEAGTFVFGTTAGSVTKVSGTTNTIASDTDTNLCAYWDGANTIPTIKNRLGAANRIIIRYEFT